MKELTKKIAKTATILFIVVTVLVVLLINLLKYILL